MNLGGRRGIDAWTLGTLLPLWLRASGFEVRCSVDRAGDAVVAIAVTDSHTVERAAAWFAAMSRDVEIRDGRLLFAVRGGFVYAKIAKGGENGADSR